MEEPLQVFSHHLHKYLWYVRYDCGCHILQDNHEQKAGNLIRTKERLVDNFHSLMGPRIV